MACVSAALCLESVMGLTTSWLGILDDNTTLLLSQALALPPHTEDDMGQCPGGTLPPQLLLY